uniref:NADP-dependent oxidoreductase domain-containing protein n=1 Tax=Spermophilus dauricus TaxID=99837 RepID=A0A8C9Q8R2_SPEDA
AVFPLFLFEILLIAWVFKYFFGLFFQVPKSEVIKATKLAIEAGFRHIDSAYVYQVEEEVGLAIRSKIEDGTVKREDIFYTSKLWSTFHKPDLVRPSLEQSLKKLQLDYVDLFLIHFPLPLQSGMSLIPKDEQGKAISEAVDLCDTWEAMEKCKDAGLTKSIGVSNFNCQHLEMILNKPGLKYKPVCNQVSTLRLLSFCSSCAAAGLPLASLSCAWCLCGLEDSADRASVCMGLQDA